MLRYLVARRVLRRTALNRSFDIGGPDVLTYEQMMQRYAAVAGLPRRLIVPRADAVAAAVEPLGGVW